MAKKIAIFILILLILSTFYSSKFEVRGDSVVSSQVIDEVSARKLDPEAQILSNYLTRFDSPLQYHAQDFVDAARVYGLDWKMLPAIAGVESTFGKFIPGGYNAWGWGVYGDQAIYFGSWREAMFTIAKGLRENYLDRGLTEPYAMNRAYATSPHWGGKVTYFMNDMEKFAQKYEAENIVADVGFPPVKIAATSGLLTQR
ncbi:MAG: Uncharacterized protein G01um10147_1010 [Microgenomates group bacterium Gr01-1014_7]|nr:MAG: Uncharacterized protein G01um10147_1010 [Microgenomates group bacterium Gr01-1014_7]